MEEKYETLSLAALKELAKARGIKGVSAAKKSRIIEVLREYDTAAQSGQEQPVQQRRLRAERSEKKAREQSVQERQPQAEQAAEQRAQERPVQERQTQAEPAPQRRQAQGGPEQRVRPRTDRPQAVRGAYENRPPRMAAAQENRPLRGRAAQDGRSLRTSSSQDGRSPRVYSSPESRAPQVTAFAEGRASYTSSSPDSRAPRATTSAEGRASYASSSPDSRATRAAMSAEGRASNAASAQESRASYASTAAENCPSYAAPAQESRPAAEPRAAAVSPTGLSDTDKPPAELAQLDSGQTITGILEVMQDGYGFIRGENYLPGETDVYVSPSQIRRFNMKTGDVICGNTRIKTQQEKFSALLYVRSISGMAPSEAAHRCNFEDMTPVFPNKRLRMERGSRAVAMRIVDLFSPIGKGQRGMIVSPPKAGKTTLLKDVARSILQNDPDMQLIILLIDERPEEVTDIREAICGDNVEVIYSTFDELPEHHKRVSEMTIERAKRLVEQKKDVTILLDSITRLARAYNLTVPPSGRTLSGGLDPAALHMPKRFFGAARNMREGGSLTVLATALIDTGSKMDDVVYEEFKGTGNMELVLDRKLSEKRLFPAIDIPKSGTRREDLLLDREEYEAVEIMRRALNGMKSDDAVENILNMFVHTRDNRELVQRVRRQKFI